MRWLVVPDGIIRYHCAESVIFVRASRFDHRACPDGRGNIGL